MAIAAEAFVAQQAGDKERYLSLTKEALGQEKAAYQKTH